MNRFLVSLTIAISAKNKEQAKRLAKQLIETGAYTNESGTSYVVLSKEHLANMKVEELPF